MIDGYRIGHDIAGRWKSLGFTDNKFNIRSQKWLDAIKQRAITSAKLTQIYVTVLGH